MIKDKPDAAPDARAPEDKRDPELWAAELGFTAKPQWSGLAGVALVDAIHGGADSLHGWSLYQHVRGEPFMVTKSDYMAARDAAAKTDDKGRNTPHEPARARLE